MKKFFILIGLSVGMISSTVSADALKNSLTNIMNTKDSSSMVDLGNINLNAKPRPVKKVRKKRSSKAVVATINKHKIIKKDADNYIAQRTQGKIKNFDSLPPKQQKRLIQEMALPYLALDAAKEELSELEQQTILTRMWIQKESQTIQIKDEDVLTVYNQMKQQAIDNNATKQIPPFETVKDRLRLQMIEKSVITNLMKDVKIEVAP